jgi:DNA-binding MarR family transcriptional regulator
VTRSKSSPQLSAEADLPGDEPFDYPLAGSIGSQLRQTYRYFERDLQQYLSAYDIPVGMWYFLRALWEEDGLSQRELSDRAGSTPQAAAEQLRKMEQRGLLERRRSNVDKRKVHIFLTEEAHELRRQRLPYAAQVNTIALEGLSAGEIAFLRIALARMKANFVRHWAKNGITTSISEPAKRRPGFEDE